MTTLELTISYDERYKTLVNRLQNFSAFVDEVVWDTVQDVIEPAILPEAQTEPGAVHTPIRWTSERQRKFVMAQIRKGTIASPYVRTHAVSQGWHFDIITTVGESTTVILANKSLAFTYVEGLRQQRWHKDTGWFSIADKYPLWGDKIIKDIKVAFDKKWGA